ncbi:MAG: transcription antitermination factor NusB [Desulfovibrionaceae bacterium]|nr:transcription antitermination factor NusB [Desulfovibrionaceae bacterium]
MKTAALSVTARSAALAALELVEGGQTAQTALAHMLTGAGQALSPADKNLCSELVYGVLRNELRLDHVLRCFLKRPQGLPPKLVLVMRMGAYSLLFQEKIPPHAAVHSAVALARAVCGQNLSRVVNGVLRSVQRLGQAPLEPDFYLQGASPEAGLALFYSLPLWLMALWRQAYGEEAALRLAGRSQARPWTGLRFNRQHDSAAGLRQALTQVLEPGCWEAVGAHGLAVAPGHLPEAVAGQSLAGWHDQGVFSYQSAGSQLVLEALGCLGWAGPVWDACAGYGGKSVPLLEAGARVSLASDMSRERLRHVPGLCRRLGLVAPMLLLADAGRSPLRRWPGHIIADVPCSGLGVLARRPDLRKRASPENTRRLMQTQARILAGLAERLQMGNELAYITCTLDPAENERAIGAFLVAHKGFELRCQWQSDHAHPWLEGMYGAVLRKR